MAIVPAGADRVRYLFVAMESSLDWAGGIAKQARALQRRGWRCFNNSPEDLTFHFAAQRWLLRRDEGYAITDLGKCALPVAVAKRTYSERYENCLPWLHEELRLLNPSVLVAVGRPAFDHLVALRSEGWPPILGVIHWSVQNTMNVHRLPFARSRLGLPSAQRLANWRLRAYEGRSWHPEGYRGRAQAERVTRFHLQLLAIYRRQFAAVRAYARAPGPATTRRALAVGVKVAR